MRDLVRCLLMYGVLPLWILAGLVDWWCHRRTGIEATSGGRESAFHLVMFAQTGLGGIAAMLLEVNLGLLALLVFLFLLHEFTTWLELRFVIERRKISPVEQMVHSFMELLPLAAVLLLACLYDGSGEWSLRLKDKPLSGIYLAVSFVAITLFNVIPLVEEAWRCGRARRDDAQNRGGS
ncbi:diguanylate cyclase [Acidovorax sp. LjRoot129]|uniref:diguanylate cyclase n=1 Tax=Acidovorax sp. LjRoot129 TaxID=3342260 RepID=UPI003ECEBA49